MPFTNIWISSGSISISNWRERRLDILNVNPRCYSIPWPNRNEENNVRNFLPSEVHKSKRNREFKIPDQKGQDPRERKYWFGCLADSFSIASVSKILMVKVSRKLDTVIQKILIFAQTAETVYNSQSREQGLVKQEKLEDNTIYRSLALVKERQFHSRGQHRCKFIGTKKRVCIRKDSTPTGLPWYTNMAAVALFWNTNMAVVTWKRSEEAVLLSRETSEVFNWSGYDHCFLGNSGNEERLRVLQVSNPGKPEFSQAFLSQLFNFLKLVNNS